MRRLACCVATALTLAACSGAPSPEVVPPDLAELVPGMTLDQVQARWGDTDCFFVAEWGGRRFLAAGYGLDPASGEVQGLGSCEATHLALYFDEDRLAFWGEAQ
jgi:hypothetical protein